METYSRHKITSKEKIPFSPIQYSKFKFGNKQVSRKFGHDLAEGFIKDFLTKEMIENQIVICSSPYHFIPTATYALKDYFVQKLNLFLVENGGEAIEEAKIHRTITYTQDYGAMSAQEREKLIGQDSFYIDKEFVKGKIVLFLDDIKITGSHEKVIQKMIDKQKLETKQNVFIYFAELVNTEIDPTIENYLNHAFVKNLSDLQSLLKNDKFLINTRMVKYMLNSPRKDFDIFIKKIPDSLARNIYNLSLGNKYYKISSYQQNMKALRELIRD